MKKTFPIHGIFGIVLLLLSQLLLFKKVDPFYSWFYCFAWWSYILIIDAVIYRLKGNSLLLNRTGEFFLMIPWSIFLWLIFEAANLSLENWYYINLPKSTVERWVGYAVAYATVLPGMFETTELLETAGLFKNLKIKKMIISGGGHFVLILLGTFCLVVSMLIPEYFFPLIWVGFIFLLEPFIYRFGGKSLLKDLEEGNLKKIFFLLLAGLICGILWEFWNFWALSKWVYTVPFFEEGKGFEMPVPGFLGFPPFAIEVYVMYNFISLFRFGRGWEESTYGLHPDKKTRPLAIVLTAILIGSFYILIFKAIDIKTVDSYFPRLQDAYWIELQHRMELPKVGMNTIEDLLFKTVEKKDKEELALRLLIPKEILVQWVEKAQLVQLKGLGIKNLQLLERVGIHSISALATEDPEELYIKIGQSAQKETPSRKAKIRIWVREAKKQVRREG
ncbi:MAG: hypothetical protein A2026_10340 [Deltaproteobacteria bacterium RBG_19FT_COMBO_46_12]|nr:MAG: hypothetical protein A2026_10340 [Deltaproteobacteria bacterium RBG_19FT_COMBO_46_12]